MVRRVAHSLVSAGKSDAALRATALAYLRAGQNVDAAAEALFVHPNTVRHRLTRAEELLGHRITQDAARVEVCLAWLEVYDVAAVA